MNYLSRNVVHSAEVIVFEQPGKSLLWKTKHIRIFSLRCNLLIAANAALAQATASWARDNWFFDKNNFFDRDDFFDRKKIFVDSDDRKDGD